MFMWKRLPACVCLLMSAGVARADANAYTDIAVGTGRELLSGDAADWATSYVDIGHQFSPRKSLALRVATNERFGLRDHMFTLSTYLPVDSKTTAFVEVVKSPQHHFLVQDSVQIQFARAFDNGYGAAIGLREARYDTARVTIGEITAERYFSDYRVAFSLYPSHSSLAGNAMSYRLSVAAYYGARSNLQLALVQGTELDRLSAAAPVISARVRATTVYGRHALNEAWALDYAVGCSKRADVTHNQFNVGATFRFR
jgi:YaiO family outer membrane protein